MDYFRYDPRQDIVAAQYVAGEPLDEMLAVARLVNEGTDIAEVPAWGCLIVKIPRSTEPITYDLMHMDNGDWLYVRKSTAGYMNTSTDKDFQETYRPAAA